MNADNSLEFVKEHTENSWAVDEVIFFDQFIDHFILFVVLNWNRCDIQSDQFDCLLNIRHRPKISSEDSLNLFTKWLAAYFVINLSIESIIDQSFIYLIAL